jgi:hypothetical protein
VAGAPGPRYTGPLALICMLPSASFSPFGTFSGNPVAVPGMFHTSQCTWSSVVLFRATSGSCMWRKKVTVPGGVLVQLRAGDTCSPACVYFTGIGSPSGHAGVVRVIAGLGG